MAAGGFKEFVAGETLDEDEINDFLMQGMLVFAGTAARGSAITSPVEGQFSFLADSDTVEFYDGTAWVQLSTEAPYAEVSTTPTGNYNDGVYDWDYWVYKTNGSLVIDTAGLLDVLIVAGGGGASGGESSTLSGGGGGAGGLSRFESCVHAAGTASIVIGSGGAGAGGSNNASNGTESEFASTLYGTGGGGAGATRGQNGFFGGSGGGAGGELAGGSAKIGGLKEFGRGNNGGNSNTNSFSGGGGGGAGAVGTNGASNVGGNGGVGSIEDIITASIATAESVGEVSGSDVYFAGGGGGGGNTTGGTGGLGGGGNGASLATPENGAANTGGGAGGRENGTGGTGGSGVVIVRTRV
jgi:hypothetical protein